MSSSQPALLAAEAIRAARERDGGEAATPRTGVPAHPAAGAEANARSGPTSRMTMVQALRSAMDVMLSLIHI